MQRAGFAAMTRERGGARRVNTIHPVLQLHLTRRLNTKRTHHVFSLNQNSDLRFLSFGLGEFRPADRSSLTMPLTLPSDLKTWQALK